MELDQTTQDRIKRATIAHLRQRLIHSKANIHLSQLVLTAGEELRAVGQVVRVPRESAFVFVDLAPAYNWAHPCEYHLYDVKTQELYHRVPACLPPEFMLRHADRMVAFHTPVTMPRPANLRTRLRPPLRFKANALSNAPGERYAILFAGRAANRHTNDLEHIYRTLVDVYGFATANIHVLNHDGTINYFWDSTTAGVPAPAWPGDDTAFRMVVNDQGTRAGMQNVLNALAARIRPEDFLFIHTNNHGGGPCDPGITDYCLFQYDVNASWVPYYVNDFIADLGVLPRLEVLMVMMEQCRAGGFINPIVNNSPAAWTHVATSVNAGDYSQGGSDFDPYARDWTAAIAGHYPEITAQFPQGQGLTQPVDGNSDGRLSAAEIAAYADAVHQYDGSELNHCPDGTALHLGDSPIFGEAPAGCGSYAFLGLPAHDLYVRDNLEDHGREPLINGGISCSPDIIVFNRELLDPEATLASPAAQASDTLGETIEFGQDNFIYLRVQNRGTQPTSGSATLYWADGTTLPTPASWRLISDRIDIPTVNPREMKIVGPVPWARENIPAVGHYCFVCLIKSGDDPAPDPAMIHTIDDYFHFIRESNNATWKNFDVKNVFKDSVNSFPFAIQGWPKIKLSADLIIDLVQLPPTASASLKIRTRLTTGAIAENLVLAEESELIRRYQMQAGRRALLRHLKLQPSDKSEALLEVFIPTNTPDGNYRVAVAEVVDGKEMGRVTWMLAVGAYPFMANINTGEVHVANCEWTRRISPPHKAAYESLEKALRHHFNGCRFCLPEYSTD